MNRYVKVKGHNNWFLVLTSSDIGPEDLNETMKEKILRSQVAKLHDPNATMDFTHRLIMAATYDLNYQSLADKYGTILIRPIGSFMPLYGNEITKETYDTDFPIEEFGEIVICENDEVADYDWVKYLKTNFPDKKIVTINYFDLRSENEVSQYFSHAKYITFSTTFTSYEWFKKLTKLSTDEHEIIGYCFNPDNWKEARKINKNVKIVKKL
jgi:hypothetical protein